MESTTHKQLAQAATQNANLANIRASSYTRELDTIPEDDGIKKNSLQSKIASLQNDAAGHLSTAAGHKADATSAEIKEAEVESKKLQAEQEEIQKEEQKLQEKSEKEIEEKNKPKESKFDFSSKDDSGDGLLFLNESRDIGLKPTGDAVAFTVAPVQTKDQAIDTSSDKTKDQEPIKGAGAAATGS